MKLQKYYIKRIIIGIINNPITNEIFYASKNEGAFLNGESIKVSDRKKLKDALFVATFSAEKKTSRKNKYKIFGKISLKNYIKIIVKSKK